MIAKERTSSNLPVRFELRVREALATSCSHFHFLQQGSDKFTVRYVFGPRGASKAELILTQELDYEKQNLYTLTVLAIVSVRLRCASKSLAHARRLPTAAAINR